MHTPAAVADDTPEFPGCGWFDSSWELAQGLVVIEHPVLDTVANALGLDTWLAWHAAVAIRKPGCAMIAG